MLNIASVPANKATCLFTLVLFSEMIRNTEERGAVLLIEFSVMLTQCSQAWADPPCRSATLWHCARAGVRLASIGSTVRCARARCGIHSYRMPQWPGSASTVNAPTLDEEGWGPCHRSAYAASLLLWEGFVSKYVTDETVRTCSSFIHVIIFLQLQIAWKC